MRAWIDEAMAATRLQLEEIPFSRVLRSQWDRLEERIAADDSPDHPYEVVVLFREFHNNLLVDLGGA